MNCRDLGLNDLNGQIQQIAQVELYTITNLNYVCN